MRRPILPCTVALLLAACAPFSGQTPVPSDAILAQPSGKIPFVAASVERVPRGGYRLTWQGLDSGAVRIFASPAPDGRSGAKAIGQAGPADKSLNVSPALGERWYFTLQPERGAPLVLADRTLHLSTAPNFRDIGGYRTSDGHWVKPGLIYRSDQLDRLSDRDLATIGALKPGLLVDLRTASERSREPDRVPPQTPQLILDVAADNSGSLGGDMRKAQAAIASGQGIALLTAANRDFVSLPSARAAYGALMRRLAQGIDGPLIYHCTAGKDRTGWATTVILTLLGVPRETVMADYLASNGYLQAKNEAVLAALKTSDAPINPAFLEPVLTVRREYLQSAFDEVERKYGSFDAYVREGLGLSSSDIIALQRQYLIGD